jgi:D-alanyl-D-alanine carboxypeptidase/D-alanyl-D-alanine-endopeptidase (penicillin-binding protein 4)
MKKIPLYLLLSLHCGALLATNFQQPVNRLVNQIDPNINMSALVVDLSTGETLYERNSSNVLIPASNMKLFSDAAALLILGPDYRFKTQLSTSATRLENGVLNGSLYVTLPGDPSFTTAHLDTLLAELQTWGVREIKGNVVLVSSHSNVDPYPPGWVTKDLMYSYGAPLAPVMLDENRLTVTVNPNARAGQLALIELSNKDGSIALDNQVKTAEKTTGCGLDYRMDANNHLVVRGCVGVGQWAAMQRIAIQNPLQYAQSQVVARLKHVNITLNGNVVLGNAPSTPALLLATHASKPISQLMADTLKPSDNLYADSLYLQAANALHGSPLNWAEAQPVIKSFLQQQTGVALNQAILIDGSGLSRNDRLSAQQTVTLLRFLHARFPLAYEYIAALPIAGQDGTLQKRLKKPTQQGFIRAKTGSMTGVVSLSGYLYTANAHTLAFAIYINRNPKTNPNVSGRYRSLVDGLCDFFLQQKPDDRRVASLTNAHSRVSFQQRPTQAEVNRAQQSRWRRIEYALKQALKGAPVSILFRGDQLVLRDQSSDANSVWHALQNVRQKYPFAVALEGKSAPGASGNAPLLFWVKDTPSNSRTWIIRNSAF